MNYELAVIAGDLTEFQKEMEKFKKDNMIHEKFISSQLVQIPNPSYMKGITSATQPEFTTTVIISAVIYFVKKKPSQKE